MKSVPLIKIFTPKQQFQKYMSPEKEFEKIPLILNLINGMNDIRKTMKNQKYKLRFNKLNRSKDSRINSEKMANPYKNKINKFNKDCFQESPEEEKILPEIKIISLGSKNSETSAETHKSLQVPNNNFNIAKLPKKNIEQNYNCNININMEKNIIMDKWEDNNPENQKETVIFSNDINEGESEMSIKTIDILTNTYSDITSKSSSSFINYKLGQESKEEISSISSLK
jgi:hypothetical protein